MNYLDLPSELRLQIQSYLDNSDYRSLLLTNSKTAVPLTQKEYVERRYHDKELDKLVRQADRVGINYRLKQGDRFSMKLLRFSLRWVTVREFHHFLEVTDNLDPNVIFMEILRLSRLDLEKSFLKVGHSFDAGLLDRAISQYEINSNYLVVVKSLLKYRNPTYHSLLLAVKSPILLQCLLQSEAPFSFQLLRDAVIFNAYASLVYLLKRFELSDPQLEELLELAIQHEQLSLARLFLEEGVTIKPSDFHRARSVAMLQLLSQYNPEIPEAALRDAVLTGDYERTRFLYRPDFEIFLIAVRLGFLDLLPLFVDDLTPTQLRKGYLEGLYSAEITSYFLERVQPQSEDLALAQSLEVRFILEKELNNS